MYFTGKADNLAKDLKVCNINSIDETVLRLEPHPAVLPEKSFYICLLIKKRYNNITVIHIILPPDYNHIIIQDTCLNHAFPPYCKHKKFAHAGKVGGERK